MTTVTVEKKWKLNRSTRLGVEEQPTGYWRYGALGDLALTDYQGPRNKLVSDLWVSPLQHPKLSHQQFKDEMFYGQKFGSTLVGQFGRST